MYLVGWTLGELPLTGAAAAVSDPNPRGLRDGHGGQHGAQQQPGHRLRRGHGGGSGGWVAGAGFDQKNGKGSQLSVKQWHPLWLP